ncbi:MAG: hypothetical protein ABI603_08950 [Acidobacteriota bacterium]
MSILNSLRRSHHLDDAALAAVCAENRLAARPGHPHLADCATCRARFTQLEGWLDQLKADTVAEADELFPAERLAAQRAQIFRRLEAAEHPTRVIAFPKFAPPATSRSSGTPRWIAAAAAAGLIVGVGVGQMMDFRHLASSRPSGVQARLSVQQSEPASPSRETAGDEAFLRDLDASLSRPSVPELRAFDEFTPHAGEPPR